MEKFLEIIHDFNLVSVLFRTVLAVVLGGSVGYERKRHGRDAGARTHALLCVGSAMTVMAGLYATQLLGLGGDPMRISAQVISGIGFLCAGTIMTRNHSHIMGLTTAACLWATASMGLAIGMGFYSGALICFLAMEIILTGLFRKKYMAQIHNFYLELRSVDSVNDFCDQIREQDSSMQLLAPKTGHNAQVGVALSIRSRQDTRELLQWLRSLEQVVFVLPQKP